MVAGMEQTSAKADAQLLSASLHRLPEPEVRPAFVVVSGLPGTGKTRFSMALAKRYPLTVLESDALRRVLFPSPSYTGEESSRLFRAIHLLIEELLNKGVPVILDATNLSEQNREYLYAIAERTGARLILVNIEAPPDLVQRRLRRREAAKGLHEHSEADWAVYRAMLPTVEKITRRHYNADSSKDVTPTLDKIIREIQKGVSS
jgi:predicted kinase